MGIICILVAWQMIFAAPIAAADSVHEAAQHLVISELQVAGKTSASQEFIELHNPTGKKIVIQDWILEYKSSSSQDVPSSWSKKLTLQAELPPGGYMLLATQEFGVRADIVMPSMLAGGGGAIRIKDSGGEVVDAVAYGAAQGVSSAGLPAPAPAPGASLERLPGDLMIGNGTDSDDSSADFTIRLAPEPQDSTAAPELTVALEPEDQAEPQLRQDELPGAAGRIMITELLPDPVSPQTDARDEFVELYNAGSEPAELAGLSLKAGSGSFMLPPVLLAPNTYMAFYAHQTGLTLANSGSTVALLDRTGVALATTQYGVSGPGEAWALTDSGWGWTALPTPEAPNEILVTAGAAAKQIAKSTAKKSSPAKLATPKVAAKKSSAAKPKQVKAVSAKAAAPSMPDAANHVVERWLLITLGCLTIGYAIYEFRYDLYNLYLKLRRNRGAGAKP